MNNDEHSNFSWIEPNSWQNWDFSGVSDNELIACCLWEYARESRTIKMVADYHWSLGREIHFKENYLENPDLKESHDKESAIIEERLRREGFDYDDFCKQFWMTDFPLLDIYWALTQNVMDGAEPWQVLTSEFRESLIEKVGKSSVISPLKLASIGELEKLWNLNAAELLEIRLEELSPEDDSEDMHLYDESTVVKSGFDDEEEPTECLTAAFTVDFSRFTNTEITVAFQKWLKSNRPEKWERPRRKLAVSSQKGRKLLDYRVALERLGLMRLLHWSSPAELREENPAAWEKYKRKEPDFRREIRFACKFFRLLYPFLPSEELPESVERHGIWWPEMLKVVEKVEEDMGLNGAVNSP